MGDIKPVLGLSLDAFQTYVILAGIAVPVGNGGQGELLATLGAGSPFSGRAYPGQFPAVYQGSLAWRQPWTILGLELETDIGIRATFMGNFRANSSFIELFTVPLSLGFRL